MSDLRIYRIKSYSNKPWVVYRGTTKLATFGTLEQAKGRYPDAQFGVAQPPVKPTERKSDTQLIHEDAIQLLRHWLTIAHLKNQRVITRPVMELLIQTAEQHHEKLFNSQLSHDKEEL